MTPAQKSLYALHLAVMLLGVTALFSKIIPLSALDITFARAVIACVTLFFLVSALRGHWRLNSGRDYMVAVILGVLMATHWVTYFASMQYSSVSVGMIALFTFPVITVLLEPFFEGIRLVWQDVVSACVVFLGIFLIVPEVSLSNDTTVGIVIGVVSAVLYSLRNLIHRKYFSHYSGAKAMAWQTLIIIITLVAFVSPDLTSADPATYAWLLVLGTLCTAAPHALIATTLQHLRAKTFSLVACMQPFYGVILAMLVLGEKPNWQTFLGGALVICAAVYETINTHRIHGRDRQAD